MGLSNKSNFNDFTPAGVYSDRGDFRFSGLVRQPPLFLTWHRRTYHTPGGSASVIDAAPAQDTTPPPMPYHFPATVSAGRMTRPPLSSQLPCGRLCL